MKKTKARLIAVIMVITLFSAYYLFDRFSFAREQPLYSIKAKTDTTLTIGIIGDSWATGGELDSILSEMLKSRGLINKIVSSGHPGARSKMVYQNLFAQRNKEHSSRAVIERHPEYCVVFAGVNDAAGQVGANNYSHHVAMIIKTLRSYKIKPIIVELPEFGIVEYTNQMNFVTGNRNKLFSQFTNSGKLDNIQSYRAVLEEKLELEGYKRDLLLVDFDAVCSDFSQCRDLFADFAHLSAKGKKLLGVQITNLIVGDIKHRNSSSQLQSFDVNDTTSYPIVRY